MTIITISVIMYTRCILVNRRLMKRSHPPVFPQTYPQNQSPQQKTEEEGKQATSGVDHNRLVTSHPLAPPTFTASASATYTHHIH